MTPSEQTIEDLADIFFEMIMEVIEKQLLDAA